MNRSVDEFDYLSEDPSFRRRYWIVTRHYDEDAADDVAVRALEEILEQLFATINEHSKYFHYACGQIERGKEGRPHIQLFIHSHMRFRVGTLRNRLDDPHLYCRSMTYGNADQMRKYCIKTEGRITKPRHWPSPTAWRPPKMQQVEDLDIVEHFIGLRNIDGTPYNPAVLFEVREGTAVRNWRFLFKWWEVVSDYYRNRDSFNRDRDISEVKNVLNSIEPLFPSGEEE